MELKEKINELSNKFAITEQELYDALLLEIPPMLDIDQYLSIQAVMIHYTRETPKIILNFIHTLLDRVDISCFGFENTMYRIFHKFKSFDEKQGVAYLAETFGYYHLVKASIFLYHIDLIEEMKFKIE